MNLHDIQRLYDFTDQTVVITGGTGVLGREMVIALAGLGAKVAVISRSGGLPAELVERLKDVRGPVIPIQADVLQRETLIEAEQKIRTQFGIPNILINAAGGNSPTATTSSDQSFFDLPEEGLRFVVDQNLFGTIRSCQIFGRAMVAQNKGVILNVASMASFRPLTRIAAYSAAKAGVSNFTQWLAVHIAQEYSPHIRVNAIAPGFFITGQNRFALTDRDTGALTERGTRIVAHTPMGRMGQPDDLVGALLWLISPASAFVTGIVVPVDGGFSAYGGV